MASAKTLDPFASQARTSSGPWVCGDCRSMNPARQTRCYRCRVPRATAELARDSAAVSSAAPRSERTVVAAAERLGVRYRRTSALAAVTVILIIGYVVLVFAVAALWSGYVLPDGRLASDLAQGGPLLAIEVAALACLSGGVIVWSVWIAAVVSNVPALTARWPPHSPLSAFLAAFIPFIWLKRPYSVVRGVFATLAPNRPRPGLLALVWWVSVLVMYFGPTVALFLQPHGAPPARMVSDLLAIHAGLATFSAIFAVGVVLTVEREQRAALARRETETASER